MPGTSYDLFRRDESTGLHHGNPGLDSNDNGATRNCEALDSSAYRFRIANEVDCGLNALASSQRQGANSDILLSAMDGLRRTPPPREFQLLLGYVDRDHSTTKDLGHLYRVNANASTCAKKQHIVKWTDAGTFSHAMPGSAYRVGRNGRRLKVQTGRNWDEILSRQAYVIRKPTIYMNADKATTIDAERLTTHLTPPTVATIQVEVHRTSCADCRRLDITANFYYYAGKLVTDNPRRLPPKCSASYVIQGETNASSAYRHYRLTTLRPRNFSFNASKRATPLVQQHRSHH